MTVLSKSEFAKRVGRSAGRVSQWIKAGQLSAPALRDDGSIDLELACQQLNLTLDVVQQAAQAAQPIVDKPAEAEDLPANDAQRRLLEAKAESAEHDAAKRRRERLSENGQWLRAEEARIGWQRTLAELLNQIEAEFPNMADALLAVPAGDKRSLIIALRSEFRKVRAKVSAIGAERRDALPEAAAVQDELVDA